MDDSGTRREPLTVHAPDIPGVCVGWRAWTVVETSAGPRLASPMRGPTIWPPDHALVAQCTLRGHEVPGPSCTCGLYAVHDPTEVAWVVPDRTVMGYVALWGRVVEGERGWRASRGFPLMLLCPPTMPPARRRRLAEAYRVPVVPLPRGLDRLGCLEDERVRDLAAAVRLQAAAPSPALARRIDRLSDAVTAAVLAEQAEPHRRASRQSRRSHLVKTACRVLDAAVHLTVLAAILLTAAVAQPVVDRVLPVATTIVDAASGRTVAVVWASVAAVVALRAVAIGPSLRILRRRYPRAGPAPGSRAGGVAAGVVLALGVFAASWLGFSAFRESVLSGSLWTTVALLTAGALAPVLTRHRAPHAAFRDPAAPYDESSTYSVAVSTAEAWAAAHGALPAARRSRISRRPAC